MRLLIVRHGDPDYSIDSLTEKGWKEARLLAERLKNIPAAAYYCSPLGRAKDTASFTLQAAHREAEILPWLREFEGRIEHPDRPGKLSGCWDWLPESWTQEPKFFDKDDWLDTAAMRSGNVKEQYEWVIKEFDALLEKHGYRRNGLVYDVLRGNQDTIVLFCHFGLECVLLSHLLNLSPMVLWQGFIAAPTSVTTVNTEERKAGIASFRMAAFGDISHLYAAQEPPAFAGRFSETYYEGNDRHPSEP